MMTLDITLPVITFVVILIRSNKSPVGMLDRPRTATASGTDQQDDEEEEDEDEELPSYLREQSSDEEDAALYSKKKLNAKG